MVTQLSNSHQLMELLLSAGMGLLLGMYYDVFRVIRIVQQPSARIIFVQDVLFFATSAVITFLFTMTINGGQLRLYIMAGLLAGFLVYYMTIGRLVVRFAKMVTSAISRAWSAFWRVVLWPFRKISSLLFRHIQTIWGKFIVFLKKSRVFFKKLLKKRPKLLYNQEKDATNMGS